VDGLESGASYVFIVCIKLKEQNWEDESFVLVLDFICVNNLSAECEAVCFSVELCSSVYCSLAVNVGLIVSVSANE